jgi:hypothetical protein
VQTIHYPTKLQVFIFYFLPRNKPVVRKFSTILYTILLNGTSDTGFFLQTFRRHLFHDHTHFAKVYKWTVPVQETKFLTFHNHILPDIQHKYQWLSRVPALIRKRSCGPSPWSHLASFVFLRSDARLEVRFVSACIKTLQTLL